MNKTTATALKLLDQYGLRKTKSRIAVLEVLLQLDKPVNREDISKKVSRTAPDKTTIYRTLDLFDSKGLVHKVFLQDRIRYYELGHRCTETQCHPHFTCIHCGTSRCMVNVTVPLASNLPKGYTLQHQRVQLEGICIKCNDHRQYSAGRVT